MGVGRSSSICFRLLAESLQLATRELAGQRFISAFRTAHIVTMNLSLLNDAHRHCPRACATHSWPFPIPFKSLDTTSGGVGRVHPPLLYRDSDRDRDMEVDINV